MEVLGGVFYSFLKMDSILAIDVVNKDAFFDSSTVEVKGIANRIVHVNLPVIEIENEYFLKTKCGRRPHRSPFCKSHTEVGI